MKYIRRQIQEKIESSLFKGRAIIIYGPRRSGKTTLVKDMLNQLKILVESSSY